MRAEARWTMMVRSGTAPGCGILSTRVATVTINHSSHILTSPPSDYSFIQSVPAVKISSRRAEELIHI